MVLRGKINNDNFFCQKVLTRKVVSDIVTMTRKVVRMKMFFVTMNIFFVKWAVTGSNEFETETV